MAVGDVCDKWALEVDLIRAASLHADMRQASILHERGIEEMPDAGEVNCYYGNPCGWWC